MVLIIFQINKCCEYSSNKCCEYSSNKCVGNISNLANGWTFETPPTFESLQNKSKINKKKELLRFTREVTGIFLPKFEIDSANYYYYYYYYHAIIITFLLIKMKIIIILIIIIIILIIIIIIIITIIIFPIISQTSANNLFEERDKSQR